MSMTKKDFIALADAIREHNTVMAHALQTHGGDEEELMFNKSQLDTLAHFCKTQNPQFKRDRWLAYIAGECGPNGGAR